MLDKMREHGGNWMVKLALGGVSLVFIFWGYGVNKSGSIENYAAKVNGEPIPLDEFERRYRQAEQMARLQRNSSIDDNFLMKSVLDELVEEELLVQFAKESGIRVSPEEVRDKIIHEPFLADEKTGEFIGKDKMLAFFKERGIEITDFEENVRKELLLDKARKFIEDSVKVAPQEVKDEFLARNEKVNLSYLLVDAPALSSWVERTPLSQADIDGWLKEHPGEVEKIYDQEKESRYTIPAKVSLLQITLHKPAAAAKKSDDDLAALKRRADRALVAAGQDWKKAAETFSDGLPWEKTGVPREFSRRELLPVVAEKTIGPLEAAGAAFDPAKQAPQLVETPSAFLIVEVKAFTPEKRTELDEALKKKIVQEQIRLSRASQEVDHFAQEGFQRLQKGESITRIAASRGLAVKETGLFNRREEIPGVPDSTATMVADAFRLEKPGQLLAAPGGGPLKVGTGYLLAVVKEHDRPDDKAFEAGKESVQASLTRIEGAEAYRAWRTQAESKAKIVENPRLLGKTDNS